MEHTATNHVFVHLNTILSKHNLAKLISEDILPSLAVWVCVLHALLGTYIHTPSLIHTDVTWCADRIYSCKKKTLFKQIRHLFGGHRYRHKRTNKKEKTEISQSVGSSLHCTLISFLTTSTCHNKQRAFSSWSSFAVQETGCGFSILVLKVQAQPFIPQSLNKCSSWIGFLICLLQICITT